MGLIGIINSIRLIHSRFSLAAADVVGITQAIASVRAERDQLEKTVSFLTHTAKQLQNEVDLMKCSEVDLKNLASQQNVRFDYLIDLVVEHKMSEEQQKVSGMSAVCAVYQCSYVKYQNKPLVTPLIF